jgi:radical SAM superfamily enzyme YgiQ (UPF0313 family)
MIQAHPDWSCERVFHPDESVDGLDLAECPVSYESERTLQEYSIIAFSIAYELELPGLMRMLSVSGIPPLREDRSDPMPLVLAGGPLTFSNPTTLTPFVDVILLGESEELLPRILDKIAHEPHRERMLDELAQLPSVLIPARETTWNASIARAPDTRLPAYSTIVTPNTELTNMQLVEAERGCSRGCTYCVMRRSTNGGMRIFDPDAVLARVRDDVQRVGLVGAAVSDHPRIVDIIDQLVERGCQVGLSSLRPDKLKERFIAALSRAGYRTLTTALDGASERLRLSIDRRGRVPHYEDAARLARQYHMDKLKLYLMLGLPDETEQDIDECAQFVTSLSRLIPVTLGISPFCAKRHTPLDGTPFAGVTLVQARLSQLRNKLAGRAQVGATSARWAWVEHVLSQGGPEEGRAVLHALQLGGTFSSYRAAFKPLGHHPDGQNSKSRVPPRASSRLPLAPRD